MPSKAQGGGITIVTWSQGGIMVTGLFNSLETIPGMTDFVRDYVKSIVLYEPPMTAVWGLEPGETDKALFWGKEGDPQELFVRYVTGYFPNSASFLSTRTGKTPLTLTHSLCDDPKFQELAKDATDGANTAAIFHAHIHDDAGERGEITRRAVLKMAMSNDLERVGLIYGNQGPPECLKGCWMIEDVFKEAGKAEKCVLHVVDGGNHFVQMWMPQQ